MQDGLLLWLFPQPEAKLEAKLVDLFSLKRYKRDLRVSALSFGKSFVNCHRGATGCIEDSIDLGAYLCSVVVIDPSTDNEPVQFKLYDRSIRCGDRCLCKIEKIHLTKIKKILLTKIKTVHDGWLWGVSIAMQGSRIRSRMEKSHSKRHELFVCWIVSILMVLNVQQTRIYLHYWFK